MAARSETGLALRLSGFYITMFIVIGVMLPFWPVWLAGQALSEIEIGFIVAIPVIAKVLISPLAASLADRTGRRKVLLLMITGGGALAYALYFVASGFWALAAIAVVAGSIWAPAMSFGDNITSLATRETRLQYGRIRLWGSLSFIVTAWSMGEFLEGVDVDWILISVVGAMGLLFLACTQLPNVKTPSPLRGDKPARLLLADKTFLVFLIAVSCIHGSHGIYYSFATLHWQSLGLSDGLIGWLWSEGVLAEVILFAAGAWVGRHLSAAAMILLAAGCCVVRWTVMAYDPGLPVLLVIQTFHAFTYGAMHLGAIRFMAQYIPPEMSATAQGLYSAASFGLGIGIIMMTSGFLYDALGAQAYLGMTLLAFGGTLASVYLVRADRAGRHQLNAT